jgi:hypothetical protein
MENEYSGLSVSRLYKNSIALVLTIFIPADL